MLHLGEDQSPRLIVGNPDNHSYEIARTGSSGGQRTAAPTRSFSRFQAPLAARLTYQKTERLPKYLDSLSVESLPRKTPALTVLSTLSSEDRRPGTKVIPYHQKTCEPIQLWV
jgi:hypothetical protein